MKERPILFSTPMVKAIIDGQKTMTRRTKGLKMLKCENWYITACKKYLSEWFFHKTHSIGRAEKVYVGICPYGEPGDILWVRETFCQSWDNAHKRWNPLYKADGKIVIDEDGIAKWKPSIHMPKDYARIWLQITSIKPERLHDISDEDIKAEGVRIPVNGLGTGKVLLALGEKNTAIDFLPKGCLAPDAPKLTQSQLLHAFWAELWCKINGRESYDKNPWLWAISFKVLSTTGKPENL